MPPMPSMPPESSPGSTGLDDPRLSPGGHWPDDEPRDEPDPDWPDDWPDDDQAGPSWPGMPPAPGRSGGGPRRRPLALAAVAAVALTAGAGVALILMRGASSAPSAGPGSPPSSVAPSFGAPGGSGSGGGVLPGSGAGNIQMFIGGKVLAVSGTSITIGGPNHTVTAAVTSSTRITGRVSSIRAVKAGDLVTAQITQSGGRATVTAIQDPASLPSAGSLP